MELSGAIIRAEIISVSRVRDLVRQLSNVEWRPSAIAERHAVTRVRELVDEKQRDALSAGHDRAAEICDETLSEIAPESFNLVRKYWGLALSKTSAPQFTKYKNKHFIATHRDTGEAYPDRLFSVVTYLTEEYSGGEIVFPGLRKSLHPRVGETLIFPSDMLHSVNPVETGEKQIFLFFIDRHPAT